MARAITDEARERAPLDGDDGGSGEGRMAAASWYDAVSPRLPVDLCRVLSRVPGHGTCEVMSSADDGSVFGGDALARAMLDISREMATGSLGSGLVVEEKLVHAAMKHVGFRLTSGMDINWQTFMSEVEHVYVMKRKYSGVGTASTSRVCAPRPEEEQKRPPMTPALEYFEKIQRRDAEWNDIEAFASDSDSDSDDGGTVDDDVMGTVTVRTVNFGGVESCLLAVGMATDKIAKSQPGESCEEDTDCGVSHSKRSSDVQKLSIPRINCDATLARTAWRRLVDNFASPLKLSIIQGCLEREREGRLGQDGDEEDRVETILKEGRQGAASSTSYHPFLDLPPEILHNIVFRLPAVDLCSCMASCRRLNSACDDNEIWIQLCQKDFKIWDGYDPKAAVRPERQQPADIDVSDARFVYGDLYTRRAEKHRESERRQNQEQQRVRNSIRSYRGLSPNWRIRGLMGSRFPVIDYPSDYFFTHG